MAPSDVLRHALGANVVVVVLRFKAMNSECLHEEIDLTPAIKTEVEEESRSVH